MATPLRDPSEARGRHPLRVLEISFDHKINQPPNTHFSHTDIHTYLSNQDCGLLPERCKEHQSIPKIEFGFYDPLSFWGLLYLHSSNQTWQLKPTKKMDVLMGKISINGGFSRN